MHPHVALAHAPDAASVLVIARISCISAWQLAHVAHGNAPDSAEVVSAGLAERLADGAALLVLQVQRAVALFVHLDKAEKALEQVAWLTANEARGSRRCHGEVEQRRGAEKKNIIVFLPHAAPAHDPEK